MATKYTLNGGTGELDVNPDKQNKVTWGDQMLRGQKGVFPKMNPNEMAKKHLPKGNEYVHEQVTYDSVLGRFVGGKSKRTYQGMKEAVQQNANFDQLEYLEALGKGEAWAFERNDKLMALAYDQAEKRNTKKELEERKKQKRIANYTKQQWGIADKKGNSPNEIFKDSVKRKEAARTVLDNLKKVDEEAAKRKPLVVTTEIIEKPLDQIIRERAEETLRAEQKAWDSVYGQGGIPDLKRPT
jgi:hypothetical protein